ncbi:hypothetical protein [Bradyrhizobium sp. SZCCHNS3053]|uniref:hypothetical protein n=1 Tax=Bradyrhizobium sp. SZCCHNS3053 TaxID=3057322 RepID=UPI002915DA91|nr:hypothetical protein [Bradyrhizobium sp. SZCCHNS3053]
MIFTGITRPEAPDFVARCPAACTAERCVISTVGVCKHPYLSPDEGCGPITMANRNEARKLLGILPNGEVIG